MLNQNFITLAPVIIKIGSKVLLKENGAPNYALIAHIVEQIAHLHKSKGKIVFVTSGAVGCGMEVLGFSKRPSQLCDLQACAAVGQVRLMRLYQDFFAQIGCSVGQILITHDDLKNRKRHLNIKNTIDTLWKNNIIPIVNENDTVCVDEIKFGDNDVLASLLGMLLEAKILLLLTSEKGFLVEKADGTKEVLPQILKLDKEVLSHIKAHKTGLSLGGMQSKLICANNMLHAGGISIIASGFEKNIIDNIFAGNFSSGTIVGDFDSAKLKKIPSKKRWLAFYHKPQGLIKIDDGAKNAITNKGKSILAVGIKEVLGDFTKGSVIQVQDLNGDLIAQGISQFDSKDIQKIMGLETINIKNLLGQSAELEVMHRDNMVLLQGKNENE